MLAMDCANWGFSAIPLPEFYQEVVGNEPRWPTLWAKSSPTLMRRMIEFIENTDCRLTVSDWNWMLKQHGCFENLPKDSIDWPNKPDLQQLFGDMRVESS